MSVRISLTRGQFALVDDADAETIGHFKWMAKPKQCAEGGFYAQRTIRPHGKKCTLYLHRAIVGAAHGQVVDHINGDGLDNRRENLRITDLSGNNSNRRYAGSSGFRGVYKVGNRWRAILRARGGSFNGGYFDDPAEAARSYDALAFEHFGDLATLNFPKVGA